MTRTIYLIATLQLLGCDTPKINSNVSSNSENARLFEFCILDDEGDTISKDFLVRIKMPFDTTFMAPVPHVISYKRFEKIEKLLV